MSKDDLSVAQFLKGVSEYAHLLAQRIDPGGRRHHPVAVSLDALAADAGGCFLYLTHRLPASVETHELSHDQPAAWTEEITL